MTKPRKFTFELTLDTKIEGGKTLQQWAHLVGIPAVQAVAVANTLLDSGVWKAIPSVEIEFVKDAEIVPPQIQPKRRGRQPKVKEQGDEGAGREAALKLLSESTAAPVTRVKRDPVVVEAEMAWESRIRAYALMAQPWSDTWPPLSTCPPDILQRYGVTA